MIEKIKVKRVTKSKNSLSHSRRHFMPALRAVKYQINGSICYSLTCTLPKVLTIAKKYCRFINTSSSKINKRRDKIYVKGFTCITRLTVSKNIYAQIQTYASTYYCKRSEHASLKKVFDRMLDPRVSQSILYASAFLNGEHLALCTHEISRYRKIIDANLPQIPIPIKGPNLSVAQSIYRTMCVWEERRNTVNHFKISKQRHRGTYNVECSFKFFRSLRDDPSSLLTLSDEPFSLLTKSNINKSKNYKNLHAPIRHSIPKSKLFILVIKIKMKKELFSFCLSGVCLSDSKFRLSNNQSSKECKLALSGIIGLTALSCLDSRSTSKDNLSYLSTDFLYNWKLRIISTIIGGFLYKLLLTIGLLTHSKWKS